MAHSQEEVRQRWRKGVKITADTKVSIIDSLISKAKRARENRAFRVEERATKQLEKAKTNATREEELFKLKLEALERKKILQEKTLELKRTEQELRELGGGSILDKLFYSPPIKAKGKRKKI